MYPTADAAIAAPHGFQCGNLDREFEKTAMAIPSISLELGYILHFTFRLEFGILLKDCEVLKLEVSYLAGTCICGILTQRWEDICPF
jgi:hypothetical protein